MLLQFKGILFSELTKRIVLLDGLFSVLCPGWKDWNSLGTETCQSISIASEGVTFWN